MDSQDTHSWSNTHSAPSTEAASERPLLRSLWRGFRGRCPHCGEGKMFRAFLKVVDRCEVCGEDLSHHRADDAPPYFVIFITGHVVVPLSLSVEFNYAPPYWLHLVLWLPLTLIMALGLLTPVKGTIVALQWAYRMHGFGGKDINDPDPIEATTP